MEAGSVSEDQLSEERVRAAQVENVAAARSSSCESCSRREGSGPIVLMREQIAWQRAS